MSQADFVSRGQALVTAGQYQEAVKVCRLGLLGRPTTVEGRIVLGQALLALKRYDEVLAEMRVALELDHGSVTAQLLKGEALLRKGDSQSAVEVFQRARTQAPTDRRLAQLLGEAERATGRPTMSASHPSVGFVADESTKHYPNHGAEDEDTGDDADLDKQDSAGEYTRPTTVQVPGSKSRPAPEAPMRRDATPPPSVLAVGDRSGTVEVDPERDGVQLGDEDDDFGEVAPAPAKLGKSRPMRIEEPRGLVRGASQVPAHARRTAKAEAEVSSVELESNELIELDEAIPVAKAPARRLPGPGTAVREAVKMPSGPIDQPAGRPFVPGQGGPYQPPLPQMSVGQPHLMQMNPVGPVQPPNPRSQIAAALPTAAAIPIPQHPYGVSPQPPYGVSPQPPYGVSPQPAYGVSPQPPYGVSPQHPYGVSPQPPYGVSPQMAAAAARPTIALTAAQQESAAAVDALFGGEAPQAPGQPGPAWAHSTMGAGSPQHLAQNRAVAGADEVTRQPDEIDSQIAMLVAGSGGSAPVAMFGDPASNTPSKPLKTGMRRARTRFQIAIWILIGAAVIGGGVFAGFQIRAVRLGKQIAHAREQAVNLAKADTWQGWAGARDRLAGIAQASNTLDNRAALARARAVLAFEFGDGLAETRTAVEQLGGQGGVDGAIAAAYLALADNDPKAAKAAADKAIELAPNDAAALYVAGQALLLAATYKEAIAALRSAADREPRPMYAVGLARAIGATGAWDDGLAAVDRALGAMPEHPAALIERAALLVAAGRIAPGLPLAMEVRAQLGKLISEGGKPFAEQTRGVSPYQTALAGLALAQIEFALHDGIAARTAYSNAINVGVDDQRFADGLLETLILVGDLELAQKAAAKALTVWPTNRRARVAQAEISIARGTPADALEVFAKGTDLIAMPIAQTVRGQARLASGDLDGAKADFDVALKKLPSLEAALVGRAWIELRSGDVDLARQHIEPKFNPSSSSVALTTVYAAILRAGNDAASRDKARTILERVATGPQTADVVRAHLELARVCRDQGDLKSARSSYAEAIKTGNFDARLELGLLYIDDRDPVGGRDTLDALLKDAGPTPPANLLLETARARMLVGDHPGALLLLDQADKLPNVERWQLERERGRLALRKGDLTGATEALQKALDGCGADSETFLLAADVVAAPDVKPGALHAKLKALTPARLKGIPEGSIVIGKLALAAGNDAEAETAYQAGRKALEDVKASQRRVAQAHFGIAALAYKRGDDPSAQSELDLVILEDPSIYNAYLFAAEIAQSRKVPGANALAMGLASRAVTFNPDLLDGWVMVGRLAAKAGNTKSLADAVAHVGALAPDSDAYKELKKLR